MSIPVLVLVLGMAARQPVVVSAETVDPDEEVPTEMMNSKDIG